MGEDYSLNAPIVLLTGATGFIGGATLARLLQTYPNCRVLLLVRAPTLADASVRCWVRAMRITC